MTDARPQPYALWFAAAGCCLACTGESPSADRTAVDSTADSSAVGNPSPSQDEAATSTGRAGSTSVGAAGSTSSGAGGARVVVPGASSEFGGGAGGSGSAAGQPNVVAGGGRPGAGVGETVGGSGGGTPDGSHAPGGAPAQGGSPTSTVPGGQGGVGQGGSLGSGGSAGADPGSELPPYVPAGYQLVHDESFSEPSSFDQLLIANEAEWFHSPEGYVEFTAATYAPPYRSPFSLALIQGVSASSFVLEVEMLQTGVGLGHRDMVVAWNVVNPSEFYYAHVSAEHDDVAHHIHIVNQADRAAITETFTPGFDWGTDVWRTLRVVRDAVSGTMDVYDVDNDELILSATDSTFTTGFFGVGSFDNTGRVRNLRIWSPDATETAIPFTF